MWFGSSASHLLVSSELSCLEELISLMTERTQRRSWGKNNDVAFLLCAVEVLAVVAGGVARAFGVHGSLWTHLAVWLWLACGIGSLGYSIAGLLKVPNRRESLLTTFFCSVLFVLCAAGFALV